MSQFELQDLAATPRSRRAVVKGVAWSLPIVAVAVAAPAASASSVSHSLVFSDNAVAGASCDVVDGLTVTLLNNGEPVVGESVEITLPLHFAWVDGTKDVRSFVTDSAGHIPLDAIKMGGAAGNYSIVASHNSGATGVATVKVFSDALTKIGGFYEDYPLVPAGSTAVGPGTFLSPANDLFILGRLVAGGVTSAVADQTVQGLFAVSWVDASGAHTFESGTTWNFTTPPVTATAVGVNLFLDPDNILYEGDDELDQKVSSAHAARNEAGLNVMTWMTTDDGPWLKTGPDNAIKLFSYFTSLRVMGPRTFVDPSSGNCIYFLTASGQWWQFSTATDGVEFGVRDLRSHFNGEGHLVLTWIDSAGRLVFRTGAANDGGIVTRTTGFPRTATSRVVGPGLSLEANGDLYSMDELIGTNLTSAYAVHDSQAVLNTTYIRDGSACTF